MKVLEGKVDSQCLTLSVAVPRLDGPSAADLKREVDELWEPGITHVVVDLGQVEFIDSFGIGGLLSINKRLPKGKGGVKLVNVKETVKDAIELLRLHRILEIEP